MGLRGTGLVFRASLRHGWRGLLGIGLLVGLAGGAVLTGVGAARRTDSAIVRMQEGTEAWDVLVNPNGGTESALQVEDIAVLPDVVDVGRADGVLMGPETIDSVTDLSQGSIVLASDGVVGYDFGRPVLSAGRLPDPEAANEVFLSERAAERYDVGVGDTLTGRVLHFEDVTGADTAATPAEAVAAYNSPDFGALVDLQVVGVGTFFDQVVVDEQFDGGSINVTPAFWAEYDQPSAGYWGAMVRLTSRSATQRFREQVEALVPDETVATQTALEVEDQVDRAVRPEVSALLVFSLVAMAVALVVVGQALSRRLQLDAVHDEPLRALGCTRPQRVIVALGRVALAAAVGAFLAAVIAVLASPIAPIGVVRPAEPDPGIRVEWLPLAGGVVLVFLATVALAVWPAVQAARTRPRVRPVSRISTWLAATGAPPSLVTGARFALEPGRVGVPTRATLAGAATSVVLVVATVTFAASLDHFVETPTLYGAPWTDVVSLDSATTDDISSDAYDPLIDQLEAADEITGFGRLSPGQLTLDGQSTPAFALERSSRPLAPVVLDGRAPAATDEVGLGTTTMDDLDVAVGDDVAVSRPDGEERTLRVVGRLVLPVVAAYPGADKTTLGQGALLTPDGLEAWSPTFDTLGVAVAAADGADIDEVLADLDPGDPSFAFSLNETGQPSDVASLNRVRSTPLALAALLAALIALTVAHALGAAVRARRRDLAILRTCGFTRRQVVATVATQATLIAGIGLLVGVPVGLALGRLSWTAVVDRLGAVAEAITPWPALGVVVLAVLLIANLVGLVPGLRAARAHPADTLRTE